MEIRGSVGFDGLIIFVWGEKTFGKVVVVVVVVVVAVAFSCQVWFFDVVPCFPQHNRTHHKE